MPTIFKNLFPLIQHLIREPRIWLRFPRIRPFSITSFLIGVRIKRLGIVPATIIDGGANIGQFSRALSELFPDADIQSFEPVPELAESASNNLSDRKHVRIYPIGLGETSGFVLINRNRYSQSSSLLSLSDNAKKLHSKIADVIEQVDVRIERLDTLYADTKLAQPVLLKLDLQGYELFALKGAKQLLTRIEYLLLEVAIVPSYIDEPPVEDLLRFVDSSGFTQIAVLNEVRSSNGIIIQQDILFHNTSFE